MHNLPGEFVQTNLEVHGDDGRQWLDNLPSLLREIERRWSLMIQAPYPNLSFNYTAPAVRADSTHAVLKAGFPSPEFRNEAEALLHYDGRGMAKLLAVDEDRGVMLLERLEPGECLDTIEDEDEATRIAVDVMRKLWRPIATDYPFPTVSDWGLGFARYHERFPDGGPLPAALVDRAERLFTELADSMEDPVLLHGDCHHFNILSATREPWLVIDPKGVVGEPAYEIGAFLRNPSPRRREVQARRIDIFAEELELDRERILSWAIAQAALSAWWCIEDNGDCAEQAIACAEVL